MEKLKKICEGPLPIGFLENLKIISVNNCGVLLSVLSCALLCRVNNLKSLEVNECLQLQQVFQSQGIAVEHYVLPSLKKLKLKELPKLSNIWKEPIPAGSLQTLEELYVGCCNSMKSLLTFSQAQRLTQLMILQISKCDQLESLISDVEISKGPPGRSLIFQNLRQWSFGRTEQKSSAAGGTRGDQVEKEALPQLRTLILHRLANLRSFCRGGELLELASLECVRVSRCPKLKRLPLGVGTAPKLQVIEGTDREWLQGLDREDESIKSHFLGFFKCIEK
ncbi:hypothetical protein H6P81_007081 [Aristolochia fimbriata]|uniref:Disease resistance protein At4g27190-like leucine-rich repeats domain-containing protein n=1 Tax=Aristolochia fimbriata TaxID=158543 RepID=A0AAV7EZB8_ARIFI|nr:hypothetical protein H6P81_007081 [Aristolochia fimbriata]